MSTLKKQTFPIVLSVGVFLLIAGAGRAYLSARFDALTGIFVATGIIFLIVATIAIGKPLKEFLLNIAMGRIFWNFLIVASLSVCLVCVNYLATKYNQRFDLTKIGQHTLSRTTQDIIGSLNHDVDITIFHVGIPPYYLNDLLGEYERLSNGKIKAKIIDPLVDISYAAQFGNVISGDERKTIVRCGTERRDIEFQDKPLTEEQLTNAIIKVARNKRTIYFLSGHGEYNLDDTSTSGLSTLKNLLENRNFSARNFMIGGKNRIPEDCNTLVIAGPKNPLPKNEDEILKEYLKNGGKALFLIESTPVTTEDKPLSNEEKLKNPALNNLLNPWGIKMGDDIVVDVENYVGADVGCPATRNYPKHKEIVHGLDYTFFIRPRSISMTNEQPKTVKIAPLIFTSSKETSWAETDKFLRVKLDVEDTPGPITLGTVIWEPKSETKSADTKIIVISDADFASNAFIRKYSNADLVLNALSWLSDIEKTAAIDSKTVSVEQLDLTSRQIRLIVVILMAVPLAIAWVGIIVWWKQTS